MDFGYSTKLLRLLCVRLSLGCCRSLYQRRYKSLTCFRKSNIITMYRFAQTQVNKYGTPFARKTRIIVIMTYHNAQSCCDDTPFHPAMIHILNSGLHVEKDKLKLNVNDQLPILCLFKCISPKVSSN